MASLDSLPPDQRAVLQMVLGRGRRYDDIAAMLSIDRAGVRDRALAALDALGPSTGVSSGRRHLLTDYLLGQLPPRVAEDTRKRLAEAPSERAWARVVASELAPLASGPLPEIPVEAPAQEHEPEPEEPEAAPEPAATERERTLSVVGAPAEEAERDRVPADRGVHEREASARQPQVSRLGGAILLAVGIAVVIAVVVIFVVNSGSGKKHHNTAARGSATTAASTTSASTTAKPVAQINLSAPSGSKTTAGIAEVLKRGTTTAVAIVGQGLPANTKHDAYAVWLYNAPGSAVRLGFVNPGVTSNGRLETAGALPANAGSYKQLLVTLETTANPRSPGKIVLQGALTGV